MDIGFLSNAPALAYLMIHPRSRSLLLTPSRATLAAMVFRSLKERPPGTVLAPGCMSARCRHDNLRAIYCTLALSPFTRALKTFLEIVIKL